MAEPVVVHAPRAGAPMAGDRLRRLSGEAVLAAACLAVIAVAAALPAGRLGITPWNPIPGLIFAYVVITGRIPVSALLVVVLLGGLAVGQGASGIWTEAAATVPFALLGPLLARRQQQDRPLRSLQELIWLLALALAGALLSAALQVLLLWALAHAPVDRLFIAATRIVIGDGLGAVVMTPAVLFLRSIVRRSRSPLPPMRDWLPQGGLLAAALAVMLSAGGAIEATPRAALLLVLPITWIAVSYGIPGCAFALALAEAAVAIVPALYPVAVAQLAELQLSLAVLAATGLVVGAVVDERGRMDAMLRATDRELRLRQGELAELSRAASMGGFVAILAHELAQPLTAARNLARLAQLRLDRPEPDISGGRASLADAVEAVDRAAEVMRRMRGFVKRGEVQAAPVNVADVVTETMALMRTDLADRGIVVELSLPRTVPAAIADPMHLHHILMNLVHNAAEAMASQPPPRRVRVSVAAAGGLVEIAVADNGPGIPPGITGQLFAPFVTTKPGGTGLGLAIARTLAEAQRGALRLSGNGPGGAVFTLTLPAAETGEAL